MKTVITYIRKNYYLPCLIIIFLFALFLRAYHISSTPDIIQIDEASLGYNAWSLAHYGVDRYLNPLPIYPQNFEGGQSPLYTYLVVLLIKTIGNGNLSLWLVRLPGLISSMIVLIFGVKSIALIFQRQKITLMSALLITVCPYFIMHGRFALDCNLMLGCSTIALYLLLKYIHTNNIRDLIFFSITFGITMYSYALSYFVVPIFLIAMTLYLLYMNKITVKRVILAAVCVCVTSLPVLIFICTLVFQLPPCRFLFFHIMPIASERMTDIGNTSFFYNITDIIKITLTNSTYPLDAVPKFYTMYYISIPFIIIGLTASAYHLIHSIIKRRFHFSSVFFLFYIAGLITIGFAGTHYVYRANYFFIAYLYFLVFGIVLTYRFLHSYKHYFIASLACCYLLWTLSFTRYYFTIYSMAENYTYPNSLYFVPTCDAIDYAQANWNPQALYIDCITISEFYKFYYPESPYEIAETTHEDGYGKYHFVVDYYTPLSAGSAYIVRKENRDFFKQLNRLQCEWEIVEFPHYYAIYFTPDTIIE